ncbi:AAA ATPase midasin, partial [Coemansia sp. RSA 2607]
MVHPLAPRTLNAWQLADASFFRLCATTGQLRAAAYAEHSAEVDAKQVLLILSLTQRLATHVAQDRTHAATLLQHAARWMQASVAWSSPVVSTEEQAGVVGLHELKRRVDCVLDLAMQMRGGVRAIAEAQGWRVEDAEQVAKAVQLVDAIAAGQLLPAVEQLSVVCAALSALEQAGADPHSALVLVSRLQLAADAVHAVSAAVDAVNTAVDQAASACADPWLLEPWTTPLAEASTHVRTVLDQFSAHEEVASQSEVAELAGQLATSVMVAWQEISQAQERYDAAGTETNQWGLRPQELLGRLKMMQQMAHALHLPQVTDLLVRLTGISPAIGQTSPIACVMRSWAARYSLIVQHVVALYADWHRALAHFALTTTSLLTTVLMHGLGSNDIYDSEETTESMQNGMGVGEGSTAGAKNVSDEIEGEDQVEGLQGEEPPEDGNEPGTNEDAIEMQNDFAGAMGDADLETDDEDSDKDDDEEEENEMDEQLGDVDPTDPTALDEKLWDDEEDKDAEDDGKNDSKVDSKAKGKKEQADVVAGEEDDAQGNDSQNEQADGDNDGDKDSQASGSDGEASDSEMDDDLDDGVNKDTFDRMADVEEQGEQLEMPDDLDMDDDGQASDEDAQQDESDDGLDADMHDLPEDEPIERKPDAMDEDEEDAKRQEDAEEHVKDDGEADENQQEQEQASGDEAELAGDENGEELGSDSDDADQQE